MERDTRAWLDTMVIGMNLCPFARAAMPGTKIIVLGSHVTDMPSLHSVIEAELAILADAPNDPPVTTLVVLPPTVVAVLDATTHGGFMEGAVRVAEDATRHLTAQRDTEKDRDGDLIDVVPFHPNAIFGGDVDEEDESQSNGYICTYLDVDEEGAEEGAEGGADLGDDSYSNGGEFNHDSGFMAPPATRTQIAKLRDAVADSWKWSDSLSGVLSDHWRVHGVGEPAIGSVLTWHSPKRGATADVDRDGDAEVVGTFILTLVWAT